MASDIAGGAPDDAAEADCPDVLRSSATGSSRIVPAQVDVSVDPLTAVRGQGEPVTDVLCVGQVFFDMVFTGLDEFPQLGSEVWAPGMGSSPGGIANMAVAMSRLGLRTSLAAAFGNDVYGDYCWETLADQERVDLTPSRRFDDWHSPVTVSMAIRHDRTMVTHGHQAPIGMDEMIGRPPCARACFTAFGDEPRAWLREAHADGSLVFADVGWDPSEQWSADQLDDLAYCHAFLPNATEAMAFTKTDSPERAISVLGDKVPVAVITRGPGGVLAVDNTTGESVDVQGLLVPAIDPTGAGDVFGAGFVVGTLAGWPLGDRVRFANLCAALSVQHFGGSLSSPGWGEVTHWWREVRDRSDDLAVAYGFLEDLLPGEKACTPVQRAAATVPHRPPR